MLKNTRNLLQKLRLSETKQQQLNRKMLRKKDIKLKTIFYTDDDLDDLEFFKYAVTRLPIEMFYFSDGSEMLAALNSSPPIPEIIFVDLNMPAKSGYEIIKEIKLSERYCAIPVVVISTSASNYCIEKCRALGANYYIVKPSDITKLKRALAHVIMIDWANFNPNSKEFTFQF